MNRNPDDPRNLFFSGREMINTRVNGTERSIGDRRNEHLGRESKLGVEKIQERRSKVGRTLDATRWTWRSGAAINPPVPVRFAGVICATKWPLAGIILRVDACRNNDTVKHGYLFM